MISLTLSLIILVLPFSELLRFQILPGIYLRVMDILAGALLVSLLIKNYRPLFSSVICLILAFVLLLSNLANPLNPTSVAYLGRTLIYLLLIPFFINKSLIVSKKNERLFDFGLIIFVLAGLLQYFWYPQLRNLYYLGYDPHAYRLFGLFLDPNISGLILVWAFWHFFNRPSRFQKPAIVLILIALLITYSRISWLCFLIALIYKIIIYKQKSAGLWFGSFLIIGVFFLPRHFGEGTNLWRTNSIKAKLNSTQLVIKQIKAKPILGIGFNNVHLFKSQQDKPIANNSLYGVDNSLLTVFLTSGMAGLIAYLGLFKKLWQKSSRQNRILTLIFFVHALSVNSFFTPSVLIYYLLFRITQRK